MINTAQTRFFVVFVLLAGQAILFPLYAQQPVNQEAGMLPTENKFIESPDQFLGDPVVTGGIVQETTPPVIEVETSQGKHQVRITDSGLSPDPGDKVRVYGILTEPRKIQSLNAFIVPQSGLWYTWTISFVAGLWVLFRLIRHWTVNISALCIYRRESPLSILNRGSSNGSLGGERDA